jgi:hypothetical protein
MKRVMYGRPEPVNAKRMTGRLQRTAVMLYRPQARLCWSAVPRNTAVIQNGHFVARKEVKTDNNYVTRFSPTPHRKHRAGWCFTLVT